MMPTLVEVVAAVCRLPLDVNRGNLSPIEQLRRTGYLAVRREVTVELLCDCLAKDAGLVDPWIVWSEDNRSTPTWYIKSLGPREFEVAYVDRKGRSSHQHVFDSRLRACAEYMGHELEDLADSAEMWSSPWTLVRGLVRWRSS